MDDEALRAAIEPYVRGGYSLHNVLYRLRLLLVAYLATTYGEENLYSDDQLTVMAVGVLTDMGVYVYESNKRGKSNECVQKGEQDHACA